MTPTLLDKHIKNTYTGVLHAGGEAVPETGTVPIYDGAGNRTPLSLGRYGDGVKLGDLSYPTTNNSTPIGSLMIQTESNKLELQNLSILYSQLINFLYPIGSVFFSADSSNPQDRFTGTSWIQVATGRFIVGVGTGNDGKTTKTFVPDNNSGEYSHILSIPELPTHGHNIITGFVSGADDNAGMTPWHLGSSNRALVNANGAINPSLSASATGQDTPHENTPPGFGLYVWKRTS